MDCFNLLLLFAQIILPASSQGYGFVYPDDRKPLGNLEVVCGGRGVAHSQIPSNWKFVDPNYYKYASDPVAHRPGSVYLSAPSPPSSWTPVSFSDRPLELSRASTPVPPLVHPVRSEEYVTVPVFRVESHPGNRLGARSLGFPASPSLNTFNTIKQNPIDSVNEYSNRYQAPSAPQGWFPRSSVNLTPPNPIVLVPVKTDSIREFQGCQMRGSRALKDSNYPIPVEYFRTQIPPRSPFAANLPLKASLTPIYPKPEPVNYLNPSPEVSPQSLTAARDERALTPPTMELPANSTSEPTTPDEKPDEAQSNATDKEQTTPPPVASADAPTTAAPEDAAMTRLLIEKLASEIKASNNNDPSTLILKEAAIELPEEKMRTFEMNLVPTET